MASLSGQQRFYLYAQSCIGAAVANAIINGALGWAVTKGLENFPMWRIPGVAGDLVGTAFGVTFGTCVCMAVQVPWDFRRGKITPVKVSTSVASVLGRFPRGAFRRGLVLGAISVPLFALPVVALLAAADVSGMARGSFIATKAALSAIEGAIVTPLIVLAVLGDLTAQQRG